MPNFKNAVRTLVRAPLINLIAIVSLALGIGANGAIFSLFDQMLQKPLPVENPKELVNLTAPGPRRGSTSTNQAGGQDSAFSHPMFLDLQREQQVFTDIAAHKSFSVNLGYDGQTQSGDGMLVSGSYFPVLGLNPQLGRLLAPSDDRANDGSPVVVLSHRYWQDRFDSDIGLIGEALIVNGQPLTIVGVAPAGFKSTTLGELPDVFVPISLSEQLRAGFSGMEKRNNYWIYLFARLAPQVSMIEAQASINVPFRAIIHDVEAPMMENISDATMERFKATEIVLTEGHRGQSQAIEEAGTPMLMLSLVAGLVLLIACANVANLLLARSTARTGEIAVRLSLGAGRSNVIGQLLTESVILAMIAGVLGLGVARLTLIGILSMLPPQATSMISATIEPRTIGFAAVLALATGLLFGLFPALETTRIDLSSTLKGQAGERTSSRPAARFRLVLVTAQIALSTALLISAGLFTKSLLNISRVDLGIETNHLATFSLSPQRNGYDSDVSRQLFMRVEEELAAIPGVRSATSAMVPVIAGNNWGTSVKVQGFAVEPDTDVHSNLNEVGPGFFSTMGMTVLEGREFTASDVLGSPKVAVVNEAFAAKFGLTGDVVGKRMSRDTDKDEEELDLLIVGLIKNSTYSDIRDAPPPVFYTPYRQNENLGFLNFYARTEMPPGDLLRQMAATATAIDGNLPVEDLKTMEQQIRENLGIDRVVTILSTAFALLASLLAAVGLYGVLSYTVAQRTREFGLRMALGASGPTVLRMVLKQVGSWIAVGAAIGLVAAYGLGKVASSLLFELDGADLQVFAIGTLLMVLVALFAGLFPAIRASRVAPVTALHYE